MLKQDGRLIATAIGSTPIMAGSGYRIMTGDGVPAITAAGGGMRAGAGYGHPDSTGRLHGSYGCITTAIAAGIPFRQG